jgi:hypothetical protein
MDVGQQSNVGWLEVGSTGAGRWRQIWWIRPSLCSCFLRSSHSRPREARSRRMLKRPSRRVDSSSARAYWTPRSQETASPARRFESSARSMGWPPRCSLGCRSRADIMPAKSHLKSPGEALLSRSRPIESAQAGLDTGPDGPVADGAVSGGGSRRGAACGSRKSMIVLALASRAVSAGRFHLCSIVARIDVWS